MAEYWALLNRLRHDLGKRFTVAEEHTTNPASVNLLFLHQRHDETLVVATEARWLATLIRDETTLASGEYKRLLSMVRHFFAHPDYLPSASFSWPGTAESRDELRRTLSPHRTMS